MADYIPKIQGGTITMTAGEDLTGGLCVTVNSAGKVATPSADSAAVVGVIAYDCKADEKVSVEMGGVQLVTAAATVVPGNLLQSDANGKVKPIAAEHNNHAFVALTGGGNNAVVEALHIYHG